MLFALILLSIKSDADLRIIFLAIVMGAAYVEPAICQGCGTCAAECPARAIQLTHYTDAQLRSNVRALVQPAAGFVLLESVTAGAE